jgi:hypothetical protein
MVPCGNLEFDGRAAVAAEIQMTSINKILVPGEGIEPTLFSGKRILSPALDRISICFHKKLSRNFLICVAQCVNLIDCIGIPSHPEIERDTHFSAKCPDILPCFARCAGVESAA